MLSIFGVSIVLYCRFHVKHFQRVIQTRVYFNQKYLVNFVSPIYMNWTLVYLYYVRLGLLTV